ncbi:hypothetical protein V5P93_000424 [Actinokineospora auranticolor]|uniref:Head-tail joining protein n=1 Tax=Actinokineospora auranticolor TaxID=155976 RepID=A0A2S6GEF0_9PSEU|nr:hypothetical protein [Actinokineospora auranticolor]PPK63521.1 hypothetical protein CLV40_12748 [Actinokineospora auranticolor]
MSLLDHGPDHVVIYPSMWAADQDGNHAWRPGPTGHQVTARVQPISSADLVVNGQQVATLARVITRDAPAGPWDRVEWDGRTWDVIGEPEQRGDSPATRHTTIVIRARGVNRG